MKEKIIQQLEASGTFPIVIYGMKAEIDLLSNIMNENEVIMKGVLVFTVKKTVFTFSNKKGGVLVLTTERILFLGRKKGKDNISVIEYSLENLSSIDTTVNYSQRPVKCKVILKKRGSRLVLEGILVSDALQITEIINEQKREIFNEN